MDIQLKFNKIISLYPELGHKANNNNNHEFIIGYYSSEENKNVFFTPTEPVVLKFFPILLYCQRKIIRYG